MSEMTGINIDKATSDLNNFRDAADAIVSKLAEASNTFADVIIHNWASPKAKEFAETYTYKLIDLFVKPKEVFNRLLEDAAIAAYRMAKTHGADFDSSRYIALPTTMFYGYGSLDEVVEVSPNGETGMNIPVVSEALTAFEASVNEALAEMDTLPQDIAIYDESGDIRATFADRVNSAKEKANAVVEPIKDSVNASLSTETDAVITGVQTTTEAMMGED